MWKDVIALTDDKARVVAKLLNEQFVITSYSIHYTKLYDDFPFGLNKFDLVLQFI